MKVSMSILLGALVLGLVCGALAEEKNCTMLDGFMADTCFLRFDKFYFAVFEDKIYSPAETQTDCESFQNCHPLMHCETKKQEENPDSARFIKSYCDTILYMMKEFKGCEQKLKATKWRCTLEKFYEDPCTGFFGEDDCFEKLFKETCGQKEWDRFRFVFLSYFEVIKKCQD